MEDRFIRQNEQLSRKKISEPVFKLEEKRGSYLDRETVEERKLRERYLSERDVEVLEKGLNRFSEYLMEIPKEKFPEVIILPDTAMRPVQYALKPVLREVCEKRGLSLPETRFMVTHASSVLEKLLVEDFAMDISQDEAVEMVKEDYDERGDSVLEESYWGVGGDWSDEAEKIWGKEDHLMSFSEALNFKPKYYREFGFESDLSSLNEGKKREEYRLALKLEDESRRKMDLRSLQIQALDMYEAVKNLRRRAADIIREMDKQGKDQILVVDDFINTGAAMRMLQGIFQEYLSEEQQISYFVFAKAVVGDGFYEEQNIPEKVEESLVIGSEEQYYAGFRYRQARSYKSWQVEEKKVTIGAGKSYTSQYAEVYHPVYKSTAKRDLRFIMKGIGAGIVESFSE